jgi:hypothetical protein
VGDRNISILVDNLTRCCRILKYFFMWIHMPISCSESERGSVSSSPWVSLCGGTMGVGRQWKWIHGWVVERVTKIEMTFFIVVEGGRRWGCRFNASVLAREEMWRDEILPKDEVVVVSSYWLHGKKAWHGATAWWHRPEERFLMCLVYIVRFDWTKSWAPTLHEYETLRFYMTYCELKWTKPTKIQCIPSTKILIVR